MSISALTPAEETAAQNAAAASPLLDPLLLLAALGLVACSLLTLRGAARPARLLRRAPDDLRRHRAAARAGGQPVDYSRLREYKYGLFVLMIALNLVVYGMPPSPGAHRWIPLPLFSFQSSEFGKLLLIVALSALRGRPGAAAARAAHDGADHAARAGRRR